MERRGSGRSTVKDGAQGHFPVVSRFDGEPPHGVRKHDNWGVRVRRSSRTSTTRVCVSYRSQVSSTRSVLSEPQVCESLVVFIQSAAPDSTRQSYLLNPREVRGYFPEYRRANGDGPVVGPLPVHFFVLGPQM